MFSEETSDEPADGNVGEFITSSIFADTVPSGLLISAANYEAMGFIHTADIMSYLFSLTPKLFFHCEVEDGKTMLLQSLWTIWLPCVHALISPLSSLHPSKTSDLGWVVQSLLTSPFKALICSTT